MSNIKKEKTIIADIYFGSKDLDTGICVSDSEVYAFVRKYVTQYKFAVSVFPGRCFYPGGEETCFLIRLFQYPRFPVKNEEFRDRATKMAEDIRIVFKQKRVSVVFQDETITIGSF